MPDHQTKALQTMTTLVRTLADLQAKEQATLAAIQRQMAVLADGRRSQEQASLLPVVAVLEFPCVGVGPKVYVLTEAQVAEWTTLFPAIDVKAEAKMALAWVLANNKKTHGGMPRFLQAWMARATNRRGRTTDPRDPPFTAQEIAEAKRVKANMPGRCPHEPTCANYQACLGTIIRTWRTQRGTT